MTSKADAAFLRSNFDPIEAVVKKHEHKCPGFYITGYRDENYIYEVCIRCKDVLKWYPRRSRSEREDLN